MCIRDRDIEIANRYHPDYVGFVFAPSKRQVTKEQAKKLITQLNPAILPVGVFVNTPLEELLEISHTAESVSYTHLQPT